MVGEIFMIMRRNDTGTYSGTRKVSGFYNYEEGRKVSVSKKEYKISPKLKNILKNTK